MREYAERQAPIVASESQATTASAAIPSSLESAKLPNPPIADASPHTTRPILLTDTQSTDGKDEADFEPRPPISPSNKRSFEAFAEDLGTDSSAREASASFCSIISEHHSSERHEAYLQMRNNLQSDTWKPIFLLSTNDEHTNMDKEL